ncbi:hypothetical protein FQZ97_872760 [compost metagenome]
MAGDRADGADPQAVVAPEHDGQLALAEFGVHGRVQGLVPGRHFRQMPVALARRQPGVGRAGEVASVGDPQAVAFQHGREAGHAQGFGAHGGAACARANVCGNANEADVELHGAIVRQAPRMCTPCRGALTGLVTPRRARWIR